MYLVAGHFFGFYVLHDAYSLHDELDTVRWPHHGSHLHNVVPVERLQTGYGSILDDSKQYTVTPLYLTRYKTNTCGTRRQTYQSRKRLCQVSLSIISDQLTLLRFTGS